MICTFIGHRDTPNNIKTVLKSTIIELIEKYSVNEFYVGNHGNFDSMVISSIKEISKFFPHISYTMVLAYIPQNKELCEDYSHTIYPDILENTPPKFAIKKRNYWMIEKSDFLVCYVNNKLTNACEYLEKAIKKKKTVINLAQNHQFQ